MEGPLIGIGGAAIGAALLALVQWSLNRNVKHEDQFKKEIVGRIEKLEEELKKDKETRTQESSELRQLINSTKLAHELETRGVAERIGNLSNLIGELKGTLVALTGTVEQNRDKMSAYYRAEMERLEQRMMKQLEEGRKRR